MTTKTINITAFGLLLGVFVLIVIISVAALSASGTNRLIDPADLVCYDIHSAFLDQEGYQRMSPADTLVKDMKEEKSLQCHDRRDPGRTWVVLQRWRKQ